jgi:hypothetical protein
MPSENVTISRETYHVEDDIYYVYVTIVGSMQTVNVSSENGTMSGEILTLSS